MLQKGSTMKKITALLLILLLLANLTACGGNTESSVPMESTKETAAESSTAQPESSSAAETADTQPTETTVPESPAGPQWIEPVNQPMGWPAEASYSASGILRIPADGSKDGVTYGNGRGPEGMYVKPVSEGGDICIVDTEGGRLQFYREGSRRSTKTADGCEKPMSGFLLGTEQEAVFGADGAFYLEKWDSDEFMKAELPETDTPGMVLVSRDFTADPAPYKINTGSTAFMIDASSGALTETKADYTWKITTAAVNYYDIEMPYLQVDCGEDSWFIPWWDEGSLHMEILGKVGYAEAKTQSGEVREFPLLRVAVSDVSKPKLGEDGKTNAFRCYIADYVPSGSIYRRSVIDTADWAYIPEHFAVMMNGSCYVLAPYKTETMVYSVDVGYTTVSGPASQPEDLRSLEQDILNGKTVQLTGGKPADESFGFYLDMDQDGKPESVTLETGPYKTGEEAFELLINGERCGYSQYQTQIKYREGVWDTEDEGSFRRSSAYAISLASLDGKTICLVLSSAEETYVLEMRSVHCVERQAPVLIARLRGKGKSAEEIICGKPLEAYIAGGWQVRPMDGDELDMDGDGHKDRIVQNIWLSDSPFSETLGIAGYRAQNVSEVQFGADVLAMGYLFRYDSLYYVPAEGGGYGLYCRQKYNDTEITARYAVAVIRDESFPKADYDCESLTFVKQEKSE